MRVLQLKIPFHYSLSLPASSQMPTRRGRDFSWLSDVWGIRCMRVGRGWMWPNLSLHSIPVADTRMNLKTPSVLAQLWPLWTPRPGPWTFSQPESSTISFIGGVEGWRTHPRAWCNHRLPAKPGRPLAFLGGPPCSPSGIPASPHRGSLSSRPHEAPRNVGRLTVQANPRLREMAS